MDDTTRRAALPFLLVVFAAVAAMVQRFAYAQEEALERPYLEARQFKGNTVADGHPGSLPWFFDVFGLRGPQLGDAHSLALSGARTPRWQITVSRSLEKNQLVRILPDAQLFADGTLIGALEEAGERAATEPEAAPGIGRFVWRQELGPVQIRRLALARDAEVHLRAVADFEGGEGASGAHRVPVPRTLLGELANLVLSHRAQQR